MDRQTLTPDAARKAILAGCRDPMEVSGPLDLSGLSITELPPGLACYDLRASGTGLRTLPGDISIRNRLILDECTELEVLPEGLTAGSIRARNCPKLGALPEGFRTWFLDLTGCQGLTQWPRQAWMGFGTLLLRGCRQLEFLPDWLGRLTGLDLCDCDLITDLPENLEVTGWIDLARASITAPLPQFRRALLRWDGIVIPPVAAFHPEQLTAPDILAEQNAEVRRVLMERMGYLRFAEEAHAQLLDRDTDPGGERRLIRIELPGDEPLVGLSCSCPSTGRHYLIRVPPTTTSCHAAAAWIAGFDDPSLYRPVIET